MAGRLVGGLVVWIFVAWALNMLGVTTGWLTILVLTIVLIAVIFAKPFFDGMVSSFVVASSAVSVGDEIAVDGVLGEVLDVAKRSTVLRTRDGRLVYIPYTEIVEKTVIVIMARDERRSTIELTVGFDTDLGAVDHIVEEPWQVLRRLSGWLRYEPARSERVSISLSRSGTIRDSAIRAKQSMLRSARSKWR